MKFGGGERYGKKGGVCFFFYFFDYLTGSKGKWVLDRVMLKLLGLGGCFWVRI